LRLNRLPYLIRHFAATGELALTLVNLCLRDHRIVPLFTHYVQ
jgi:hypothetical protein